MTARELIKELISLKDIDKEIKLYSLIDTENIDKDVSQFEFVSDSIDEIDEVDEQGVIYIVGSY